MASHGMVYFHLGLSLHRLLLVVTTGYQPRRRQEPSVKNNRSAEYPPDRLTDKGTANGE